MTTLYKVDKDGNIQGASQVLGNTTTLAASALAQHDSTSKGYLPPRMTTAQRDAISAPATGLLVFNTDTKRLNVYQGSSWNAVGSTTAQVFDLRGNLSISSINGLTPVSGEAYVATDAGTPTAGTSDALAVGDIAEFNGTSWKKIVTNAGGYVPVDTHAILGGSGGAIVSPYTNNTDNDKLVIFTGASNTGAIKAGAVANQATVAMEDTGHLSVYNYSVYSYNGSAPSGSWVATSAATVQSALTAHTSRTDNPHTVTKAQVGLTSVTDDAQIKASVMTTSGDTIYGGASGAATRLAGDTSNTRKFLREQAVGGVAQVPGWDTIQAGDVPTLNQSTSGTAAKATNMVGGNGTTLLGSIGYQSGTDTTTLLNPNVTTTKKFLSETGDSTNGTAPTWETISAGDVPTLNQNTSGTAAKATNMVGGNGTTLLGAMGYQSGTDTTTLLSPNVSTTKKFLRETGDGTNGTAPAWDTVTKTDVGLSSVTNDAQVKKLSSVVSGNIVTWNGTSGDAVADSGYSPSSFVPVTPQTITFNTAPTVGAFAEGKLYYDATWKTLSFEEGRDVTLQIGQEELQRVYNDTGATIHNGYAVYATGVYGAGTNDVTKVAKAIANDDTKATVIGIATQEIPTGNYGFITSRGHVNDIDTVSLGAAWLISQNLFLALMVGGTAGNSNTFTVTNSPNTGGLTFTEAGTSLVVNLGGATPTVAQVVSLLATSTKYRAGAVGAGNVVVAGAVSFAYGVDVLAGDILYLSDVVAGMYSNVKPDAPGLEVSIGRLITKHLTTGRIYVKILQTPRLNDLADVATTSPAVDEVLKWNGVNWVNSVGASVSGSAGIDFFMNDSGTPYRAIVTNQNVNEVNYLSKTPVTTTEQVDAISVTAANSPKLGEAYIYATALGRTTIDAGVWTFNTYASVSSTGGSRVSTIRRSVYTIAAGTGTITTTALGVGTRTATASSGDPFVAADDGADSSVASYLETPMGLYEIIGYTDTKHVTIAVPTSYPNEAAQVYSKWKYQFQAITPTIVALTTSYALYSSEITAPAITVALADKLGEIVFGVSNNTTTVNFVHNGTTHYSFFKTPLITLHNNLAGLDGGSSTERYHLTQAEHTAAVVAHLPLAGGTMGGNIVMATNKITGLGAPTAGTSDAATALYVDTPPAMYDAGASGSTKTITWTNGTAQKLSMNASCTFTFATPATGETYFLKLTQSGAGAFTYTWPVTVKWAGGTTPTGSATGKVDLISFYWDGTNYFGTFSLNY